MGADERGPDAPSQGGATQSQGHADDIQHTKIMGPYCKYPRGSFCVGCGCHCFLFCLFLILAGSLEKKFINQTTDVALHLWKNRWLIRSHSVAEGEKICQYDLDLGKSQNRQEIRRLGKTIYELEVVYNAGDGNMLTASKLTKAKELEDFIVDHADYPKFCLRSYGTTTCQSPMSSLMACNPSLCGQMQNHAGLPGPQAGCGNWTAQNTTPASGCLSAKSMPPGFFQCAEPNGCSRSQWTMDATFLQAKVKTFSQASFLTDFPETGAVASLDAKFGSGSATASAVLSRFTFGFPLEGFKHVGDRPQEQKKLIDDFLKKAYFEKLDTFNSKAGEDPPFLIGYGSDTISEHSINQIVNGDFTMVGMAFLAVYIYVLFMLGSCFFSNLVMAQIFLCFLSGFLIYRIVFGSFFGTFHIMAIFLLVGIGVDDVFVFNDHWQAALQVDERFKDDLHGRMTWTWKHAVQAMGVTSLTTAVGFFCNGNSAFPGMAAFGIFAGCLVVAMYTSMVFFWPAVVNCNEFLFKKSPFFCGIFEKCDKLFANTSQEAKDAQEEIKAQGDLQKPPLVRFFEDHFSIFIINHRVKVLCVFVVVSIFMFMSIADLKPAKKPPQFLPDDHPSRQYYTLMKSRFVRGGSTFNTRVHMVFGYDKDTMDRDGKDNTGEGFGEKANVGSLGDVKWNPNFVNSSGDNNMKVILGGFPCYVQLCDAAEVQSAERNTGGPSSSRVKGCFPRDIKRFLDASGRSSVWDDIVTNASDGVVDQVLAEMEVATPGYFQENKGFAQAEQIGGKVIYRFFRSNIKLTSDDSVEHDAGVALSESWERWLADQMTIGHCKRTADTWWGFVYSDQFHEFDVTKTLLGEMWNGIFLSLLVALIVLVLATGNIFVGFAAAFSIAMIVMWVMAMIPLFGWDLGLVECLVLVMVPGLSVDFTAHLAEAYNQAKYTDREHRVLHALEHSGVSIVSGSVSTSLAGLCLLPTTITFFRKFGILILLTVFFAVLFSLFFFSSLMALCGPTGDQGDWHKFIHRNLQRDVGGTKKLKVDYQRSATSACRADLEQQADSGEKSNGDGEGKETENQRGSSKDNDAVMPVTNLPGSLSE